LAAAGIDTFEMHVIAGFDAETRLEAAIPKGMGWLGAERVEGHAGWTLTVI